MQALHNAARDGDTITIPAGTFTWTNAVKITKGITLKGQTTITGAGTATPTTNDLTIIKDDTPRSGYIIVAVLSPSQSFRLTGITFSPGTTTTMASGDGAFRLHNNSDSSSNTTMRVDHCHFDSLYQGKLFWISGWVYGVADHNVMNCRPGTYSFFINHDAWGNHQNGNGSWADYPWYGTEKFWFIEDNTITCITTSGLAGIIDTYYGGRWVARHNYWQNALPLGHGTEGGAPRGQRANEFYDNTMNWTHAWSGMSQRSGTSLFHDNTFTGTEPNFQSGYSFSQYRETCARYNPVWGYADGTSAFDQNDTDGNGHYVEGKPPHLFDSGTASSGTTIVGAHATFTDSTKNWTPNQWAGYSVKNTNPAAPSHGIGSYIISNTAHTITYWYYTPNDTRVHYIYNVGDTYAIHRVLVMMDQNGRGKTDLIANHTTSPYLPYIVATGQPGWPHSALEPCYSWNNKHTPSNHSYGYRIGSEPTTKLGIDFFNLGAGFPPDTTPSEVSSTYTAALNGVDYVGPFVYPHPLVSGAPTPTPSATPSSSQHSPQRKENKGKKAKKKNKKSPRNLVNETAKHLRRRSHLVNPRRCSHGTLRGLDIRLQTMQTHPTGTWLQHLLERFYSVASEIKAR